MDRRDFLKFMGLATAAGAAILPMEAVSRSGMVILFREINALSDERFPLIAGKLGRYDGMMFYPNLYPSPSIPEPPRPRQKVNAFIHRKAGHYGF